MREASRQKVFGFGFFFGLGCRVYKNQAVKNTELFGCTTKPVSGTLRGKTAIPNGRATENTEVITASTASKIEEVYCVYQDGEFTTVISNLCLRTTICPRPFHITHRQGSHHILLFWMTSEQRACSLLLCYFCNDAVYRTEETEEHCF